MTATQTTATLAEEIGTDPRTLRKFLRSDASGIDSVGKGSRYALPSGKREVAQLAKKFAGWDEARKAKVEDEAPEGDDAE